MKVNINNVKLQEKIKEEMNEQISPDFIEEMHDLIWKFANHFDDTYMYTELLRLEKSAESSEPAVINFIKEELERIKKNLLISNEWLSKINKYNFDKYLMMVKSKIDEIENKIKKG